MEKCNVNPIIVSQFGQCAESACGKPLIDILVFVAFIAVVLFVGFFKSKGEDTAGEKGAEEYFLAGRGLSWWLIGFSLIAANISAEQFVGMSGQGAGLEGLSCASWEWIAAITLVVVAFALLPYFLRSGITTIPEFLEVRFNHWARSLMTISMMGILIVASLIGVTYAGGLVMYQFIPEVLGVELSLTACCWILGGIAGAYVLFGGLKACAWADLIQGAALIVGGAVIAYFAINALGEAEVTSLASMSDAVASEGAGALERFKVLNADKLIMGRPASDPAMPWTILLMGIWIPNFYYWGLNQYITQRILGSASLGEGQKGLVLAAGLKLLIPFVIVIPGIIAFNLFHEDMAKDAAVDFQNKAKIEHVVMADSKALPVAAIQNATPEAKRFSSEVAAKYNNKVLHFHDRVFANLAPEYQSAVQLHNASMYAKAGVVSKQQFCEKAAQSQGSVNGVTEVTFNRKHDSALGHLITKLIPKNRGVMGFVIAALLGAIVSSLAAVLNATSTLFTMDIYQRYIDPKAPQGKLVFMGRVVILLLVVIGCLSAPMIKSESIFKYIQEIQCYVSPGILAVFVFGLINRKAARWIGVAGLLVTPIVFAAFRFGMPSLHYLNAASYALIIALVAMTLFGLVFKEEKAVSFEGTTTLDMTMSKGALMTGIVICILTVALYVVFWNKAILNAVF